MDKPVAEKRDKWIHVKVSIAERNDWQARAAAVKLTVADLIREQFGAKPEGIAPKKRRESRRADPLLLANIGRVGSNLNQIARWANTHKSAAEAAQVLAALVSIEQLLSSYRPKSSGTKPEAESVDAD